MLLGDDGGILCNKDVVENPSTTTGTVVHSRLTAAYINCTIFALLLIVIDKRYIALLSASMQIFLDFVGRWIQGHTGLICTQIPFTEPLYGLILWPFYGLFELSKGPFNFRRWIYQLNDETAILYWRMANHNNKALQPMKSSLIRQYTTKVFVDIE